VTRVEFIVLGRPQPGGSKKPVRAGGRPDGRIILKEDAKRSKPWRALVAAAAHEAMGDLDPLVGPLLLEVEFYVARPSGHYGSGRNAGHVRQSAPRYPHVRPDATKLLRSLEDAMTGLVWRDDAQVVTQVARKRYGTPERAEVTVEQVTIALAEVDDRMAVQTDLARLFAEDWE
jgi:Holliday junction resolvase RusA-like endonuclease